MKLAEFESLVAPHFFEIQRICDSLNVPLDTIRCDSSINKSQRKAGKIGRICLGLADSDPGWRAKDKNWKRSELKKKVQKALAAHGVKVAVRIAANYSCLAVVDGMIHRRDNSGRVIGVSKG